MKRISFIALFVFLFFSFISVGNLIAQIVKEERNGCPKNKDRTIYDDDRTVCYPNI